MAQLEGAAGDVPNDTVVETPPSAEDRLSAAFDEEPGETDDDPPEEGQPDTETEPDLSEVELDEAEEPAIEPPVSLTAEEKDAFKTWPREAQEAISRRVGELEKGFQAKAQEASKTREMVEQQAVQVIQQLNAQRIQQLEALLPQIPDEPSAHLQIQDPVAYADRIEARRWALNQHNQARQLIQTIEQQSREMEQAATNAQLQATEAALKEHFPDYLDAAKGPELRQTLGSTALALGYSQDQLNDVTAQDILAMKKASEWKAKADKLDTLMAKQMEKVRDAKNLPRISKPGTPQGKGAISAQREQADRKAMRLGDKDAALRVFANI